MHEDLPLGRRRFLAESGARATMVGFLALGADSAVAHDRETQTAVPPESLKVDHFAEHIGAQFYFGSSVQPPVTAELIEARPLPGGGSRPSDLPRHEPFSLVFRLRPGTEMEEGIYRVQHRSLGTLAMHVAPSGAGKLCAIFN